MLGNNRKITIPHFHSSLCKFPLSYHENKLSIPCTIVISIVPLHRFVWEAYVLETQVFSCFPFYLHQWQSLQKQCELIMYLIEWFPVQDHPYKRNLLDGERKSWWKICMIHLIGNSRLLWKTFQVEVLVCKDSA